jgi:phage shock protein PspC (stress-responsive transcriptional regulator)
MNTATAPQGTDTDTYTDASSDTQERRMAQPLTRSVDDRMIAGVAGGLARYFDVDVTLVRVILAVLTVVGGAGVPLYAAGWLLIPEEGSDQSILSAFIESRQNRAR